MTIPNKRPRILLLDIETAPHRVYCWGLWGQDVHLDQIEAPGYTMCWAAKWLGDREIMYSSLHETSRWKMRRGIYDLIEEADIVVHYYGSKFDMPTLNTEFAAEGWAPPAPYHEIDLCFVVRRRFKMASNKLDFALRFFGLGAKMKHKGMELWKGCMAGDAGSWKTMKAYNKKDVQMLERLYKHVLSWIDRHPNIGLWRMGESKPICTNCGGHKVQRRGYHYAKTRVYQRWQCQTCDSWMRTRKSQKGSSVELTN